jgi:phosphatidylethanolamine/phosphatidyl-N-methylethanolamine N-methyltransferase
MAKRLLATLTDTTLFLQEWFANPQRTGAVVPSSRQLATAMARWLPSDPESFVLELGPGTGAVTQALLGQGLREERLVAIENNPKMARLLCKRFPRAHIISGDAWHLDDLLRNCHNPVENVGAVFSSLPLLNFSKDEAQTLAGKIRGILEPEGKWVQYSYHLGNGRLDDISSFQLLASKIVWLNLPPARVSVYQK